MSICKNEKGIALVTALLLTLITLTIISLVLYLVTQGIKVSASQKRYQTTLEASYGGAEFVAKDLLPTALSNTGLATPSINTPVLSSYATAGISLQMNGASDACLEQKLTKKAAGWTSCSAANKSLSPKEVPDMQFRLSGLLNQPGYNVYAKIVDTLPGNSDLSNNGGGTGASFNTGGVVTVGAGGGGGGGGAITPQSIPYIYRIEVQGEKETSPVERPILSVIYNF